MYMLHVSPISITEMAPAQAPEQRGFTPSTTRPQGALTHSSRQAVLALGRQLAGRPCGRRGAERTGAAGSLDETSWLEYEGLTGLSGLGEAPEPDSDGCMCIDSA